MSQRSEMIFRKCPQSAARLSGTVVANVPTAMITNTHLPKTVLRLTFNYAGRGIVLGALAMTLALVGCDDGDDPMNSDAAVDASGNKDTSATDTKPGDTNLNIDAAKDGSVGDAKPADAGAGDTAADTLLPLPV